MTQSFAWIIRTSTSRTSRQKCGKSAEDGDRAVWLNFNQVKTCGCGLEHGKAQRSRIADKSVFSALFGAGLGVQVSGAGGGRSLQLCDSTSEWQFDEGGVAWGKLDNPPPPSLSLRSALSSSLKTHAPGQSASDYPKRRHPLFFLAHSLPLSGPRQNPTCQITDAQASAAHRLPAPKSPASFSRKNTHSDSDGSRREGRTHLPPRKTLRKEFGGRATWGHCSDFVHCLVKLNAVSGKQKWPTNQEGLMVLALHMWGVCWVMNCVNLSICKSRGVIKFTRNFD